VAKQGPNKAASSVLRPDLREEVGYVAGTGLIGRVTMKAVPLLSRHRTLIFPLWLWTISRQIESPIPVPIRELPREQVMNGSKTLATRSGGIPGSLSEAES
jgi:hypothetical protein